MEETKKNLKQLPEPFDSINLDEIKEWPIESFFHKLDPSEKRAQFLDEHLHCPICGTELVLTHVAQFVRLEIEEEAHCSSCAIRVRAITHRIQ